MLHAFLFSIVYSHIISLVIISSIIEHYHGSNFNDEQYARSEIMWIFCDEIRLEFFTHEAQGSIRST